MRLLLAAVGHPYVQAIIMFLLVGFGLQVLTENNRGRGREMGK
jgi:hypothetical protein